MIKFKKLFFLGLCLISHGFVSAECPCGPNCSCSADCDDPTACLWENEPCGGSFFVEEPPLFRPFIADPRQITYSVGWRFHDHLFADDEIDVSFGDILALYEWGCVGPWGGRLRIELEGAVWAIFAPLQESSPLINADYYVGVPITYAFDNWSFRLRGYHISSHVGDEYLLDNLPQGFKRLNPSAEYIDFFVSNEITQDIRLYGGIGYMLFQDESFHMGPFYAAAGVEVRPYELAIIDCCCYKMYGVPIFGMHYRFQRDFKHHVDMTYVLGYEWGKLTGQCRRIRLFMEYHDGYSVEGQFSKFPTNYFAIRMSYGY